MGLPLYNRMSNLHAPTVPSGPQSAPTTNGRAAHLTFNELSRKKRILEEELKALGAVLDSVWPHALNLPSRLRQHRLTNLDR